MSNLAREHLSSSSTSVPNLVILALIVSKRTRRYDDGDDDDGVRGLSHTRLRQLRWARALKMLSDKSAINFLIWHSIFNDGNNRIQHYMQINVSGNGVTHCPLIADNI